MTNHLEQSSQNTCKKPVYGSFVSTEYKTILSNQPISWSNTTVTPCGVSYHINQPEVTVFHDGIYMIEYALYCNQGNGAALILAVNSVPLSAATLRLPDGAGQVKASILLLLNSGDVIKLLTKGQAVTLQSDTNGGLVLYRI